MIMIAWIILLFHQGSAETSRDYSYQIEGSGLELSSEEDYDYENYNNETSSVPDDNGNKVNYADLPVEGDIQERTLNLTTMFKQAQSNLEGI